jgi:hypothetical protein
VAIGAGCVCVCVCITGKLIPWPQFQFTTYK